MPACAAAPQTNDCSRAAQGIHPREPKKKTQGQNKTYYHVKDIHFLQHEPLLAKFRELRSYERKVRRAKGKARVQLRSAAQRAAGNAASKGVGKLFLLLAAVAPPDPAPPAFVQSVAARLYFWCQNN